MYCTLLCCGPAVQVCQVSGKVLFRTSAGMDVLRQLKSAERLFLLVRREAPVALPAHTSPGRSHGALKYASIIIIIILLLLSCMLYNLV